MQRSDLTGMRHERLVAIKPVGKSPTGHVLWLCQCDCGNTKEISVGQWRRTRSCGCLASEVTSKRSRTHGATKTKTFKVWSQMRRRCRDRLEYAHVSVCERWNIFENFLADMGECPSGKTIDRRDPAGNYEPSNCRWADAKQQANNRRNTVFIEIAGVIRTAEEWSEISGIQAQAIKYRLRKGWPAADLLKPTGK